MPNGPKNGRVYPVVGTDPRRDPDYGRVVRVLNDRELASELEANRGTPGYRRAVSIEIDRRLGL